MRDAGKWALMRGLYFDDQPSDKQVSSRTSIPFLNTELMTQSSQHRYFLPVCGIRRVDCPRDITAVRYSP